MHVEAVATPEPRLAIFGFNFNASRILLIKVYLTLQASIRNQERELKYLLTGDHWNWLARLGSIRGSFR